jgi:ribonuclease D
MDLVTEAAGIAAICEALAHAPVAAFDLEFASADRLVPQLCLVQVSWVDEQRHRMFDAPASAIVAVEPEIRLVDPQVADVRPIVDALAAHPCVIAHAPRQDLGLLAARHALAVMPGIVDTQLMAAFAGLGDQVGLATLANEQLGTHLGKDQQWTAWERRPLTPAQLAYATDDVRYLHALYALLARTLGATKLAWVRAESQQILADALVAAAVTPETAWEQLGGVRALDPTALAGAIALAAWRQRTAIELDRPLGQVLADKNLLDLARHRPQDAGAVRAQKGIAPIAKTRAEDIFETLARAVPAPAGEARAAPRAPSARAQRWAEMLLAIAHVVADETRIAPRLLATRGDAEQFARVADEDGLAATAALPARATWRAEVLGAAWAGWLAGTVAIVGDPSSPRGVRLSSAGDQSAR